MQAAQSVQPAPASAGADASTTVLLGGQEYTIERLSARKSSRAIALIKALGTKTDAVSSAIAKFQSEYGREHFDEYDRVQTRMLYPAKLLVDAEGDPVREPAELADGSPNPRAGEQVWAPSIVDQITEEEWAAAGGVFRDPRVPQPYEVWLAALDVALEEAEDDVYRLLALFLLTNDEVRESWRKGDFKEVLQEKADWLLDETFGDELIELAVACSERVDAQFVRKARSMGERLGNLGRLAGLTGPTPSTSQNPTPETPTPPLSNSTPSSSTPSPPPTAGDPTPSSTHPGTSSTNSSTASEETTTSEPPEQNSPAPSNLEASPAG